MYEMSLILHMAGAVMLGVGAVGLLSTLASPRTWRPVTGLVSTLDKAVPLGAGIVLATGVYMAIGTWGWDEAWLIVGLGGLMAVAPLAPVVISPGLRALVSDPASPDLIRRALLASGALVGAVLSEVILMVTKPDHITIALATFLTGPPLGLCATMLLERRGPSR